jgi:GTP cyclohydrolase I
VSKTEKGKEDGYLGNSIGKHLTKLGIETPMGYKHGDSKAQVDEIEKHMTEVMRLLNLDLNDDSLQDTPRRVAKMLVNELCWGLDYANFPKATVVENKMQYDEMVLERNIMVKSMCEHHWQSIYGVAHVAYIPGEKVLGLSKLNRVVEFFSRRPQVQERLTAQVCSALQEVLGTENVAVCIVAEHGCVRMRGVEDPCSDTVTSQLGGVFKSDPAVRAEFFSLINLKKGAS